MKWVHGLIQGLLCAPKFPGRDYLIERLPKWLIKPAQGPVCIDTRFGFKINLDPSFDRNIENVIYERGVYEQGTVAVLQDFLGQNKTFVDVGANIGFLSLLGASEVGKQGRVYAFEPFPNTYEILRANKAINHFEQIEIFPVALGAEVGTAMIYPEQDNRGGASILNHHSDKGVQIEVKKLDDFAFDRPIDVIKIDVEGFEFDVLKGALSTIKKDQPKLIIEYSIDRENTVESNEIYHWLKGLGYYKIYKLAHGKERKSALIEIKSEAELPTHDNIFCLPN